MTINLKVVFPICMIIHTFCIGQAQIPDFSWVYQLGGTGQQISNTNIVLDSKNNIVMAGLTNGIQMDIDPGPKTYFLKGKYFLIKMSPDKELLWVKEWDSKDMEWSVGLDLDEEDNIYLCGTHIRTIDLDPSEKKYLVGGLQTGYSGYYIKMDKYGNFLHGQSLGKGVGSFRTIGITAGKEEFYVTAYFEKTVDFNSNIKLISMGENDPIIICYDKEGTYKWHKTYGSNINEYLLSTCVDQNNDIISYGYFYKTMTIDGTALKTTQVTSGVLIKWDNKGNLKWAKSLGVTPFTVTTDFDNNIIVTGSYHSFVDVDPSDNVRPLYAVGGSDLCIVKLNANGEYQWAKSIGGKGEDSTCPMVIGIDRANNIYMDCFIENQQDVRIDDSTFYQVPIGANIMSLKMDRNGKIESIHHLNNPKIKAASGGTSFCCNSSTISTTGELYKTGFFEYTVDFDHNENQYVLESNGSSDYYILKLIHCRPKTETKIVNSLDPILSPKGILLETTGLYIDTFILKNGCDSIIKTHFRRLQKEETLTCLSVYPNPFLHDITLASECGFHNVRAELYTLNGILVFSKFIHDPNGKKTVLPSIELPTFSGMYMLKLTSGDEVLIEKMVKM